MVDVTPTNSNQISSDDQELAKVLAGVGQDEPAPEPAPEPEQPAEEEISEEETETVDLDSIRIKALQDIKPLLGKLDLPPDEKFDIYIEVLRASNDMTLLPPAYDITPAIEDETKRGMDLLTVIREIDSLNPPEA
ncbi:MAG: hypothetical protein LBH36_00340 [Candidatus Nomurabacteria bacterium]|jgi:hypothetical protein|nr:hypothetical protein [Candidatus Nomurabacteria bacterium]